MCFGKGSYDDGQLSDQHWREESEKPLDGPKIILKKLSKPLDALEHKNDLSLSQKLIFT
jgi:hypothetical protein